jgi:hypothetical protein
MKGIEPMKWSDAMKEPNGTDLLRTLIELLADQEQVKIKYILEGSKTK